MRIDINERWRIEGASGRWVLFGRRWGTEQAWRPWRTVEAFPTLSDALTALAEREIQVNPATVTPARAEHLVAWLRELKATLVAAAGEGAPERVRTQSDVPLNSENVKKKPVRKAAKKMGRPRGPARLARDKAEAK